ncbi:unnamed protein product [Spodoptera exigua]|nr:unnamed protein product [Spodoptera exigua]
MEISGVGKSPNASLSFRYNANNEELEELYHVCEDDPPTPQCDPPVSTPVENASPKRGERSSSIIDKYFKSIRSEKIIEKPEDVKPVESKQEEAKVKEAPVPKEVTSSPMKEYLNRLGKRSTPEVTPDVKEGSNETWKIFHDFKFKIAQAVEDMKTRSVEETKEKSIPRENSTSDSEENSAIKDSDQQSVGDTDNQVSSLDSSIQNLSEMTQPLTAKAAERDPSLPVDGKNYSDSSDETHKNLAMYNDSAELRRDFLNDSLMEVESGIEALEDNIDGFGDIQNLDPQVSSGKDQNPIPPPPTPANFGSPPSKNDMKTPKTNTKPNHFCNFFMYFLTFLIFISYVLFPNSNIWNGFVLGLWFFCFMSNLKSWVLDTYFSDVEPSSSKLLQLKRSSAMPATYTIPSVKEHRPIKKYENWINHYRVPDYDPGTYHINKTTTAFMKLEGCNLRISYTSTKIPKRALWDEKLEKVSFYQHRLYNLTGARVILLPKGLVKRRQWSKKYPICIILSDKEKIQVLEKENSSAEKKTTEATPSEKKKEPQQPQHEMETETNTSPEKKRKFVWRRREKSTSHSDGETGKEGLRHRLVRKMHRDKKTDSVSTATEPVETQSQSHVKTEKALCGEDSFHDQEIELSSRSVTSTKDDNDEEFDDNELTKIKEFLEETEMETGAEGTGEGEWSVHVKQSTDKHSHLYLFARTGRDKHEWYRRLVIAVNEANANSAETSMAEDKTGSESAESKDNIEMAVYKLTEKETVAFAKSSSKTTDSLSEGGGVTITSISQPMTIESDYEKTFWPYLLKIIQSKSATECTCRLLPAEVTWVNTVLARIMYDLMRDPIMINKLQNRIQRKLNTLKLPSFMSPLVVTELSLSGACPMVERVLPPACDPRGVWLDADLRYDGGAYIAILTQINLLKLKEKNITLEEQLMATSDTVLENDLQSAPNSAGFSSQALRLMKPAIYDSEVEDSAESSSDDESPPVQPVDSNETLAGSESGSMSNTTEGTSSKKKFLRMVDKIATNKYFQQVTDYKYVKRAMEGLSNTDIKLHLEVHALEGRLAINLPPPPHDRVWIGFRSNPQLILKARPAVGARTLRFAHITNWIEQKLSKEFEKVLVLPNMEDIIIDIMTPTPVQFE